jgi:hypothetical protein
MSKQIFKSTVPKEILFELLDKICDRYTDNGHYVVDTNSYKRMKFHNYHVGFLASLLDYYHWSKRFYVEREFTYQSFANILRQLTRLHDVEMSSNIRYGESTYAIEYYIAKKE